MKKISTFSLYVNGLIQTIPEGIQTGREYLDEKDVRYVFHEELIDHLEYLQAPYLAWLESCGVFAEEVEVERESAFTRINAFMEGFDQAIRKPLVVCWVNLRPCRVRQRVGVNNGRLPWHLREICWTGLKNSGLKGSKVNMAM